MKHKNKIYFYIAIFLLLILIYFNFKFSTFKEWYYSKEFREKHPVPLLDGFTKEDDRAYPANDLFPSNPADGNRPSFHMTPTDCVNKCAITPACVAANYEGDNNRCAIKSSATGGERKENHMLWRKNTGYKLTTIPGPSGWVSERGVDYWDTTKPIGVFFSSTSGTKYQDDIVYPPIINTAINNCIARCTPDPLCKGVSYDAWNYTCYTKSSIGNAPSSRIIDKQYYFSYKKPEPLSAIEAPSGWSRELSVDYPGNDIKSIQNSTPQNCLDSCKSTSGCKGFVFDSNTNTCYLKSLLTTSKKNTTANYYAYKDQLDAATPLPTGWKYEENTDYPGNDITPVLGLTPTQCINSCPKNDGPCKGVVYDSYNEICYKKSRF
jgi:hypothetical protein